MSMSHPSRPSLKITRHDAAESDSHFAFEVWSPFTGRYEDVASLADGMRRLEQLAGLIHLMWLRRHPRQARLMDTPPVLHPDVGDWAEVRANPDEVRSYDIRRSGRDTWVRAPGGADDVVAEACRSVGYAMGI